MPANRKPKAWNLKPKMTAAPELWRDSVMVVPFWEHTLPTRAITPGGHFDISIESGSPDMKILQSGRGLQLDATFGAYSAVQGANAPDLRSDRSYVLVMVMATESDNSGNDFDNRFEWKDGSTSDGFSCAVQIDGRFFVYTQGGNTLDQGTITIDDGLPHTIVVEWDQPGSRMRQWIDGILDYDVSYTDTSSGTNMNLNFGLVSSESQADLPRREVYLYSVSEGRVVSPPRDPFAMLRPAGF